jgi:hypothetical protein
VIKLCLPYVDKCAIRWAGAATTPEPMTLPRALALDLLRLATLLVVATLGFQRPLEAQTRPGDDAAPQVRSDSSSMEGLVAALAKATAGCGAALDTSKLDDESALQSAVAHCDAGNTPTPSRTCDHAATLLLSDRGSRDDVVGAVRKISECHEIGPHVILELRRRALPGSARDTFALEALWTMVDSRMADSVLALAKDPRHPRRDRLTLLRVLTYYADCSAGLRTDVDPDYVPVLASVTDQCGTGARERYSDSDRARIRAGFAWIGEHDPDTNLAKLARRVAEELNLWATPEDSVRREAGHKPSTVHR